MEYRELSLNIAKEFSKLSSIITKVVEIQTILNNLRWHLTVFPSDFNNIYLKYFGILQNLSRNYEILWKFTKAYKSLRKFYESLRKFMKVYESLRKFTKVYESLRKFTKVYESLRKLTKVDESYHIPQNFFGQISCFRSISFACDVIFAFHNFVLWWKKFSCLLLYRITSRQYWQIFCHRQTIGDISNIADT